MHARLKRFIKAKNGTSDPSLSTSITMSTTFAIADRLSTLSGQDGVWIRKENVILGFDVLMRVVWPIVLACVFLTLRTNVLKGTQIDMFNIKTPTRAMRILLGLLAALCMVMCLLTLLTLLGIVGSLRKMYFKQKEVGGSIDRNTPAVMLSPEGAVQDGKEQSVKEEI